VGWALHVTVLNARAKVRDEEEEDRHTAEWRVAPVGMDSVTSRVAVDDAMVVVQNDDGNMVRSGTLWGKMPLTAVLL
jgi:hypothetical protein